MALTPELILELWNELVDGEIVKRAQMTPKRRRCLLRRIKDHPNFETWSEAIRRIAVSGFCKGENNRSWVIGFSNLCEREDLVQRASEGLYDDRFTPSELARASKRRFNAWGGRCHHDPPCEDVDACVLRWARTLKASR